MNKKYDLRALQLSKHLCAVGLVFLGSLYSFQVNAQAFPATTSGNATTYTGGVYSRSSVGTVAASVSGGAMSFSTSSRIRTAAGVAFDVAVRAAPLAGAVGSVLARCLGNPVCAVASAAAIAAAANEVSYRLSTDPITGAPVVTKNDPNVCSTAPCYSYQFRIEGWGQTAWMGSISEACAAFTPLFNAYYASRNQSSTKITSCTTYTYASNGIKTAYALGSNGGGYLAYYQTAEPKPAVSVPATVEEVSNAIGSKVDGAPAAPLAPTSTIPAAVKEAVKNSDYSIGLGIPAVTGPATVTQPATVTTKADGSKTTSTTTTSLGYYGPRVEATETTVTTDTTPAGVTTTNTTTTAPATAVPPDVDACATNPNSNACRTDEFDTPSETLPKATKVITFSAENLGFAGGSCPANVRQTIAGKQVVLVDWQANCGYITNYAKPMILALATFAALMIIFAGGKPE